jgi:hypothetical protein
MKAVRLQLGELLAADATTLAPPANANVVALIKANFAPTENLVIGDLTLADFTGSTPLACGLGTQPAGVDPITGDQVIDLKDPVGGWRWETTNTANLPQTIYGYALATDSLVALLAVQLLPTPITLQAAGEAINLGVADMTIVQSPIS